MEKLGTPAPPPWEAAEYDYAAQMTPQDAAKVTTEFVQTERQERRIQNMHRILPLVMTRHEARTGYQFNFPPLAPWLGATATANEKPDTGDDPLAPFIRRITKVFGETNY